MQGKPRNNKQFDTEFQDFAWSEMSNLLDKEMPVVASHTPESKNKYSLLALFLLIGFVSGIATMWMFQEGDAELNSPVQKEEQHYPEKVAESESPLHAEASVPENRAETKELIITGHSNQLVENKIHKNV